MRRSRSLGVSPIAHAAIAACAVAGLIACSGADPKFAGPRGVASPHLARGPSPSTAIASAASSEAPAGPGALDRAFLFAQSTRRAFDEARRPTIHAPARPTGEAEPFEYADLPLADVVALDGAGSNASFEILRRESLPRSCPTNYTRVPRVVWFMPPGWSEPTVARVGALTLPSMHLLDGQYIDSSAKLDQLLSGSARPARWLMLDDAHRTGDAAEATLFDGTFDPANHRATANSERGVHARAVIPGIVYAYRACLEGCDEPLEAKGKRVEEFGLIAPVSLWLGTSVAPLDGAPITDFTWLSARVSPGNSASLLVVANIFDIAVFRGKRAAVPADEPNIATFSVDVVWEQGRAPEATLFRAAYDGGENDFPRGAGRPLPGVDPGCEHMGGGDWD